MKPWKRYQRHQYPIVEMLRAIRTEQRLRLDVLAEMIGYHWTTVSRWERGECFPSLRALHDWCEALGVQLTLAANRPSLIVATDTARKIPTMVAPLVRRKRCTIAGTDEQAIAARTRLAGA